MPASPAPRIRTEATFGSPPSLIGPLYPESDANPRLVIVCYIAALPETAPIRDSRSRRLTVTRSFDIVTHYPRFRPASHQIQVSGHRLGIRPTRNRIRPKSGA